MPGSRLGDEDRGRIAAWLADGLGYAEIGRRLGRPTSTISREVARNGGFGGYSAAEAHQAARIRARRSKPERPTDHGPDGWPDEATRDFAEELGTVLTMTGLPRMSARVFTCLLTADATATGLTAADLVRRLRVSPASVSKSIAYLAAMDLVARRSDPGDRRERYLIADDVWLRAWRSDSGAHGVVAATAHRGVEILGADTAAGARLGHMARFFGRLSGQMRGSILADAEVDDALTAVAALVHAGRPLPLGTLTDALGWPPGRVLAALTAIRAHPAIADPLVLGPDGPQTFGVTVRPDRLSPVQTAALERAVGAGPTL